MIKISKRGKKFPTYLSRTWKKNDSFQNVGTLLFTEAGLLCGSRKPRSENTSRPRFLLFINPSGRWESIFDSVYEPSDRHVHASIHSRMIASIKPWRHACVLAGSRVQKRDNDVQLQSVCLSEGKWGERVCYGGLPSTMLINYSWYDRF